MTSLSSTPWQLWDLRCPAEITRPRVMYNGHDAQHALYVPSLAEVCHQIENTFTLGTRQCCCRAKEAELDRKTQDGVAQQNLAQLRNELHTAKTKHRGRLDAEVGSA